MVSRTHTNDDNINIMVTSRISTANVNAKCIKKIASTVCHQLGLQKAELSVTFVGSQKMRTLNRDYRGKDKSTDVLSFSQIYFDKPLKVVGLGKKTASKKLKAKNKYSGQSFLLGDVVISLAEADANARLGEHTIDKEVCLLLVHGILHLCGHDHEVLKEEKAMFGEQSKLMDLFLGNKSTKNAAPAWRGCVKLRRKK